MDAQAIYDCFSKESDLRRDISGVDELQMIMAGQPIPPDIENWYSSLSVGTIHQQGKYYLLTVKAISGEEFEFTLVYENEGYRIVRITQTSTIPLGF